jgi:hypothetical protein
MQRRAQKVIGREGETATLLLNLLGETRRLDGDFATYHLHC